MVTVSMRTADIPNLYVKVWTQKSELPQENFLCSITQPNISRQGPFELTDIEYDTIEDEISGMEIFEYNNSVVINVMKFDDIEDFKKR